VGGFAAKCRKVRFAPTSLFHKEVIRPRVVASYASFVLPQAAKALSLRCSSFAQKVTLPSPVRL
jgi:hypothetical protein